jgi:predicted permease
MRKLFRRLSALFHRRRLQRELEEEMAAHREMMPADRRQHFGSTLRFQEEVAGQWGWTWLDQFRQDIAYGARWLRRSPGFALTAIAVLSLGIGVNLAEIHVFQALRHRLQVRDLDSLCRFFRVTTDGTAGAFSVPAIEFYRRYNTVLSAVISETDVPGVFHAEDSEYLRCILVSGNFFRELGVTPLYGRLLDEQDDRPGSPPVAVLGYGYWQSRFGGDPGIVLKTIRLNDKPVQVVGIASSHFGGLVQQPTPVWMPMSQYPYLTGDHHWLADYGTQGTFMLGRMKPGISLEAAEAQFRSLTAELRTQQPQYFDRNEWLKVQPAGAAPATKPEVVVLMATIILLVLQVLLAACANLGNMLLARGLARQREIEIRLAIGAGRWRIIRQLMTENFLLAALASIAALFVGKLAAHILLRIIEAPPNLRIVTDWRIVLACAALGLGATLAFGLAPAFETVKRGAKATRARKILVSLQVGVSCVLLILSSFFTRTIQQTFRTAVSFDYSGMTMVDPSFYLHSSTPAQARQAALDIAARVRQLPGIDAATVATVPPLTRRCWIGRISAQQLYLNGVDPSYFPMMRLPLLRGRLFGPREESAVVISESAARKLWPNEPPLGKSLRIDQRTRTVTGVVKDSGANLMHFPESVEAYTPIDDENAVMATILVHATSNPAKMSGALRSAATLPGIVPLVSTFQSAIARQMDTIRKIVAIVVTLGAIASWLALIGIFGLLAFTVAQRTREIGVRIALGARGFDVLQCVLGQYALPFGIGAVAGIALAAAAAKVARKLLFGFIPFDLVSFGAGLLLFAAVALAASIVPARRALRIDPASALRYE